MAYKIFILTIVLLWFELPVFGNERLIFTKQYYADNRKYAIEITGTIEEVSVEFEIGKICSFALYNAEKQELWRKDLLFYGTPALSNIGDAAIPQAADRIEFYNNSGQVIGQIPENTYEIHFYDNDYGPYVIHRYAPSGEQYYLQTKQMNREVIALQSFTRHGQEQWSLPLSETPMLDTICVTPERILITGGTTYLIESQEGRILQTYKGGAAPIFINGGNDFLLGGMKYQTSSGKEVQKISIEDMRTLLFSNDPEQIIFALNYFETRFYWKDLSILPEEIVERFKNLNKLNIFSLDENHTIWRIRKSILEQLSLGDLYYVDSRLYTGTMTYYYLNGNRYLDSTYQDGQLLYEIEYWHDYPEIKHFEFHVKKGTEHIERFKEWSHTGELIFESFYTQEGKYTERSLNEEGTWIERSDD